MMVEESLGFGLLVGQKKEVEDIILGSGTFSPHIFWHIYRLND